MPDHASHAAPSSSDLRRLEIPHHVAAREGRGGLPMWCLTTETSSAEMYVQGAHLTAFQKHGERPLIFTSPSSRFAPGQAIRGGIPVIYPWFGAREGHPMHGYARTAPWIPAESSVRPDGAVRMAWDLPPRASDDAAASCEVRYVVTLGDRLGLELSVTNRSSSREVIVENCLHTYFAVGDIRDVTVRGLRGTAYLDKVDDFARRQETGETLAIEGETDRVFLDAPQALEIEDARWGRVIKVAKHGSASTVVWNPWREKSRRMGDLGDEDYQRFLCVESGNVADNRLSLRPGQRAVLGVTLSTQELA